MTRNAAEAKVGGVVEQVRALTLSSATTCMKSNAGAPDNIPLHLTGVARAVVDELKLAVRHARA